MRNANKELQLARRPAVRIVEMYVCLMTVNNNWDKNLKFAFF
jgi:hypothetical protein